MRTSRSFIPLVVWIATTIAAAVPIHADSWKESDAWVERGVPAGTAGSAPGLWTWVKVGAYSQCVSTTCNCTPSPITSTFCHTDEFEFEVGGEVVEIKTGHKSSQCDQVQIPPSKCVSLCYEFELWKFCGLFFDSYVGRKVATVYVVIPAGCSPAAKGRMLPR